MAVEHHAGDSITARRIVNCAGLYSDVVARLAGAEPERADRSVPRRVLHAAARSASTWCTGLIYPVPDPEFPFLGVHFTRTIHGEVEAGPERGAGLRARGLHVETRCARASCSETLRYPGFWRMARKYWRTGAYEVYRSLSKAAFVKALQRLVPELRPRTSSRAARACAPRRCAATARWSTTSASSTSAGAIHVLNAPSPAATASLAIGRHIAGLAAETFGLR